MIGFLLWSSLASLMAFGQGIVSDPLNQLQDEPLLGLHRWGVETSQNPDQPFFLAFSRVSPLSPVLKSEYRFFTKSQPKEEGSSLTSFGLQKEWAFTPLDRSHRLQPYLSAGVGLGASWLWQPDQGLTSNGLEIFGVYSVGVDFIVSESFELGIRNNRFSGGFSAWTFGLFWRAFDENPNKRVREKLL